MDADNITLSGGDLGGNVEPAAGWEPGTEKKLIAGNWTYTYRRVGADPETGYAAPQAVYVGRERIV